jgi:phytoene dehydrogenase-like protein
MNAVAEKLGELGLPRPVSELAAQDWDVAIVGGGHNGLTAAAYLAREGKSVLVLERRERVGGACTLERPFSDERYVVSPCAYVVGVLDELVISELGLRERGVQISVADPALFIPFDDGTAFVEFDDEERTLAGLRELGISEKDIKGFHEYGATFDLARRRLRKGERDAWVGESPSRAELEAMLGDQELIDLVFEASISDVLDAHVDDQRIKDALYGQGLIAAYGGPKDKGTAMIHLMHHMGELGADRPGSWGYVRGGMGMISFAMCDAALEAGAEVACGVPVAAVRPGEGVELEDGTLIRARSVISNADPKRLLGMLNAGGANGDVPEAFRDRLDDWKVRSPVVKVNVALTELPRWTAAGGETWPAAGTVNCRLGLDEAQGAFERSAKGELAIGFTEMYSQTADDPSVAPPDRHVISVFCQYGPADKTVEDWDNGLREEAGNQVFGMIERFAPGFRDQVVEYEVLGPPDIEERIGLTGGCIFQGECFPDQMWENRLASRTPVEGLYLCGAATHPGGSVIGLNGRNAAMALLEDAG